MIMPGIKSPAFPFAVQIGMLLRNKNLLVCVEMPHVSEKTRMPSASSFQLIER
jgi:hypothetical protein